MNTAIMQNTSLKIQLLCCDNALFPDLLPEIGRLRIVAWEHERGRPSIAVDCGDTWIDEHDPHAYHWIIMENGILIAAARLCLHFEKDELPDAEHVNDFTDRIIFPAVFLNRLVVHPSARGAGLAKQLDAARLCFAQEKGASMAILCSSNPLRLQWLQKTQWKIMGKASKPFIAGLPTYVLNKNIGTA